ncbi:MAG TPA: NUDIX hydrolase [Chloroflexota bacterium]
MHTLGVGAVVTNPQGHVLLVRTAKAGWELPGGGVEPGEDLIGALERELLEESGCTASVGELVGVYAHVRHDLLIVIFRATSSTLTPAPQADEDVLEAAWFSAEDALRNVTHVREHEALADALSAASSARYRAYDVAG